MTTTIIILAMIAAFLGMRLWAVLGKHGQDSDTPLLPRRDEAPRTAPAAALRAGTADHGKQTAPAAPLPTVSEPQADLGMRALLQAERGFDVGRFVHGAREAYKLILAAFWRGDRDALQVLTTPESYAAFDAAISAREARGETLENRVVYIEKAVIVDASVDRGLARLVVHFVADIAAVTRDAEGKVIAGSLTDAVVTEDVWSFVRRVGDSSPDWRLDETDAG